MTGTKPTPLAIKSWQFSDGDKTLTIHLRRGMKWSDGKPFTADDFVFWFEDLYKNKDLVPAPSPYLTTKNGPAELEKVDTYAVRWRFKDPYWVFVVLLTGPTGFGGQAHDSHVSALGGYAPAHYLKQFHPKYASKEELDRKAKEGKFDNWVNLLKFKADWGMNPELPVISPWRRRRAETPPPGCWSATPTTSAWTPRAISSRTSTRWCSPWGRTWRSSI